MNQAMQLSQHISVKHACIALDVPRASYYRFIAPKTDSRMKQYNKNTKPPLALAPYERKQMLDLLHCERFIDQALYEIYASLLDEGRYLCSVRTMYRYLKQEGEINERRRQRRHVKYKKPELLATSPNMLWSWDITKLKGPKKWQYFHLYVIMDVYSRFVVGYMVAEKESAELARQLISETAKKQRIDPGALTIHADRGSSMRSKPVALLMSDLGITKSHSRPHTSNDNPYSEAQFKTLKYRPHFPERFGCLEDSRLFCRSFFKWYNDVHYHSGIGYMTPKIVHNQEDRKIYHKRKITLKQAFFKTPIRFKGRVPLPQAVPKSVWINQPKKEDIQILR